MNKDEVVAHYFDLFILPLRRCEEIDIKLVDDFIQGLLSCVKEGIIQKTLAAKLYYFYTTYLSAINKRNSKDKYKYEKSINLINDKLFIGVRKDINISEEFLSDRLDKIEKIVQDNMLSLESYGGISVQPLYRILFVYYIIERVIAKKISANPYELLDKNDPFVSISAKITKTLDEKLDLEINI